MERRQGVDTVRIGNNGLQGRDRAGRKGTAVLEKRGFVYQGSNFLPAGGGRIPAHDAQLGEGISGESTNCTFGVPAQGETSRIAAVDVPVFLITDGGEGTLLAGKSEGCAGGEGGGGGILLKVGAGGAVGFGGEGSVFTLMPNGKQEAAIAVLLDVPVHVVGVADVR